MKGKLLENIVLTVGLLMIGSAVFLMYFATTPEAAKSVNVIFASGFVIYIIYNYIMGTNLKGEIYDLNKIIANLKEEVGRLTGTITKREETIKQQKQEIAALGNELEESQKSLETVNKKLQITAQELTEAKAKLAEQNEDK